MHSFAGTEGRRFKRILSKERASVVVKLDRKQERLPCLVLDSSKSGFRLRGNFHLRRGQVVEIIFDGEPLSFMRCRVVWAGRARSEYVGEVGLETF